MDKSFISKLNIVSSASQDGNFKSLAEESNRTQKLGNECLKLYKKLQEYKIARYNAQQKLDALIQNIQDIEMKKDFMNANFHSNLSQYQTVKIPENDDLNVKLQNFCCLLGFHLTNYGYSEDESLLLRLHYNNYCYVDLELNDHDDYKVTAIEPTPPKFQDIQEFLEKTQDVQGFLINLRKYFSQLKQAEEK